MLWQLIVAVVEGSRLFFKARRQRPRIIANQPYRLHNKAIWLDHPHPVANWQPLLDTQTSFGCHPLYRWLVLSERVKLVPTDSVFYDTQTVDHDPHDRFLLTTRHWLRAAPDTTLQELARAELVDLERLLGSHGDQLLVLFFEEDN